MSIVTLLPLYWRRHGLEDAEIGWLAAGFSMAAIAVRAGLGGWLERWGRRPFLYLGALLITVFPVVYPLWGMQTGPWLLLRLLQGAGYAFYITAILTWVADSSPPDRIALRQGVFGVSGLLGSAAGPMAAESLYKLYGFPTMFRVVGAAGLVAVCLAATLPESAPARSPKDPPRVALRWQDYRAMIFVTVPFGWVVGTVMTFIAPFGDSLRLPSVALYFVGFALASVSVRLSSGGFIDTVRPARLVQISGALLALSALTLACLGYSPGTVLLFSAAILNGVGHGFLFPGLAAYTVRRAGPSGRGPALALFTGVFDSGVLMGSVFSGYLSQWRGYPSAYVFAGLLLLSALPIFTVLDRSPQPIAPSLLHFDALEVERELASSFHPDDA